MKLPALLFSDTHLTSDPADEYRWGLFPWLLKQAREHGVRTFVHLGDLTDAKDYHPSALVNRVVRAVLDLSATADVVMMPGNHDYLLRGRPFFEFLGTYPRVTYASRPTDVPDDGRGPLAIALPHTRSPTTDWADLDLSHYDVAFMHQTVRGARASNGMLMDGERLPALAARKVWSGDIHVPQVVGGVEYVGSPYHVHFGDDFHARCVLLPTRGAPVDLHFDTVKRVRIRASSVDEVIRQALWLRPGDQAKVQFTVDRADMHRWRAIESSVREVLENGRVEVHDVQMRVAQDGDARGPGHEYGRTTTLVAMGDEERTLRWVERLELGADSYEAALEAIREAAAARR